MSALNYSDVALIPCYSELRSRSQADVSVEFLGRRFVLPVIPANMETVINTDIAKWLSENDYFYIMHRFGDTEAFVHQATRENWKTVSISIGVKPEDYRLIDSLDNWWDADIDFVTIDVAHAHHVLVKDMLTYIRQRRKTTAQGYTLGPKIIAGNVATPEAVNDLVNWGADAIKVGIGGSKVCTTRHQTGFGLPMFSCVDNCFQFGNGRNGTMGRLDGRGLKSENATIPIIADGGIRENGDIAKALVAGASMVMAGGLIAACVDAPGENIYLNQNLPKGICRGPIQAKCFHGSASSRQKGEHKHVEGVELEIPCNGKTMVELYQDIKESLQSAVSYAGGKDLSAFKSVKWEEVK